MNQKIVVMGCNRWKFQELQRLCYLLKHLAQEVSDVKRTDLVLSCEAEKSIPRLFWQQIRKLTENEQEDKGIKDPNNRIRIDAKCNEESLRQHWQEIFKIQPEDNINFDEKNQPI